MFLVSSAKCFFFLTHIERFLGEIVNQSLFQGTLESLIRETGTRCSHCICGLEASLPSVLAEPESLRMLTVSYSYVHKCL